MAKIFPEKGFIDPKKINRNIGLKVVTHAVSSKNIFKKIIKDRIIDLPSKTKSNKKTPYVEQLCGLDDCNYFSAGFDYNSKFHQWSFAFMFRKSILKRKQFHTFKSYIVAKSWLVFLRYLKKYDFDTLLKIKTKGPIAKRYIGRFLETGKSGLFWQYENALIWAHKYSKVNNKITKEMRSFIKSKELSNNYAPVFVGKHYYDHFDFKEIEICSKKQVSLDDSLFLGVYVQKERLKEIVPFLKKHFSDNTLIYDGDKFKKLGFFKN